MRRILAARAIHDMFTTTHLHLTITASSLTLRDPSTNILRLQHRLREVAFWAVHSENQRLVGYIVHQSDSNAKDGSYSCYVFESDDGGKSICDALGTAARQAYAHLLDQKTHEEKKKVETKLLLENIAKLPDKNAPPEISDDGNFLMLEEENLRSSQTKKETKSETKNPESDA
ncbi:DCC-interacting protein 13-alpha [Armadillidium vulgare]|nr:DCC-interacting protein 13-alpha [Armadillidium vulgare]